jgi:hypothetical protein
MAPGVQCASQKFLVVATSSGSFPVDGFPAATLLGLANIPRVLPSADQGDGLLVEECTMLAGETTWRDQRPCANRLDVDGQVESWPVDSDCRVCRFQTGSKPPASWVPVAKNTINHSIQSR